MRKRIKKYAMQGKTSAHSRLILRSQVVELIRTGRIKTTEKKGKLLKRRFDKLVTLAKKDSEASKKRVLSFFGNKERSADRLYQVIKSYLDDRDSGYTRVLHTLNRKGDGARQVYVMLVNAQPKARISRAQRLMNRRKKQEGKSEQKKERRKGFLNRKTDPNPKKK